MQNKFKNFTPIALILIFLVFCFSFFFLNKQIKNNIKISEEMQADLQKEIARREEIKNFNNSFKLIEEKKIQLETHFAQSSDIVPFLNKIEKMADSVGTKAEVSFIEVAKDNSGLIVDLKGVGSFENIYKFISLLENSPYELEFMSVGMSSSSVQLLSKNSSKGNVWEVNLKIKLISFI